MFDTKKSSSAVAGPGYYTHCVYARCQILSCGYQNGVQGVWGKAKPRQRASLESTEMTAVAACSFWTHRRKRFTSSGIVSKVCLLVYILIKPMPRAGTRDCGCSLVPRLGGGGLHMCPIGKSDGVHVEGLGMRLSNVLVY